MLRKYIILWTSRLLLGWWLMLLYYLFLFPLEFAGNKDWRKSHRRAVLQLWGDITEVY
jgi:hypothetical protein